MITFEPGNIFELIWYSEWPLATSLPLKKTNSECYLLKAKLLTKRFKHSNTYILMDVSKNVLLNCSYKIFFSLQTLSSSELSKLNPNETTPDEIRGAFCRDVARVSRSYEVTIDLSFRCTQYWSYGCTTVQQ